MRKLLLASMMLVFSFSQAAYRTGADVRLSPRLLNYQGYLTDTLGNPVNDPSLSLSFAIFDSPSGGSQKWAETQPSVAVDKGIFSVLLGSVTPIPDSVFLNGASRYLQLTVAGQALSPRTMIVSAAYAYTSTYSDTASYARNAAADNDWIFLVSDGADTTLQPGSRWGIARFGNTLHGNADSTHVNLGVGSTTGTSGQNYKYCTVGGGALNAAGGPFSIVGGGFFNAAGGDRSTVGGGNMNTAGNAATTVAGGSLNNASGQGSVIGGGVSNYAGAAYSAILGGFADTISATGTCSYLFGLKSKLTQDSTFMVDMPHVWFGTEANGYELPRMRGANGQLMITNGTGQLSWASAPADDDWTRGTPDSILYTVDQVGIVKGGSNNMAHGTERYTHINFGVNCTTGVDTANYFYATVTGGLRNKSANNYTVVAGGTNNTAAGGASFVGSGWNNYAGANRVVVGGGQSDSSFSVYSFIGSGYSNMAGNDAADTAAVVCGGYNNEVSGKYGFVGGGRNNLADVYAAVGGGYGNCADTNYAVVGGGQNNLVRGDHSFIGGGENNRVLSYHGVVSGGWYDTVTAPYATVGGGGFNAGSGNGATVAGGYGNKARSEYAVIAGGFSNEARGTYSCVLGGYDNNAGDDNADSLAVVCGGRNNDATAHGTFIGGGDAHSASGRFSVLAGGYSNDAVGILSFLGGGRWNSAGNDINDSCAVVSGGSANEVRSRFGSIGGGTDNVVDSAYGTVPGGYYNYVRGRYGFATGNVSSVAAGHTGSAAFNGQVTTASGQLRCGTLAKAGGTFTIDHPLDPGSKILNHYFVESPEMVNIYRGSVVLDAGGRAVVSLPDYFDALNQDPQIQLTGVRSSDVWVEEEVAQNTFVIGGKPGIKVYWTVTGARKDPSARIIATLMPVEQVKKGDLVNRSLDDDFLASTIEQLESMGKAAGFNFRTAAGREKYEKTRGK